MSIIYTLSLLTDHEPAYPLAERLLHEEEGGEAFFPHPEQYHACCEPWGDGAEGGEVGGGGSMDYGFTIDLTRLPRGTRKILVRVHVAGHD
jgi:hypothetical protein